MGWSAGLGHLQRSECALCLPAFPPDAVQRGQMRRFRPYPSEWNRPCSDERSFPNAANGRNACTLNIAFLESKVDSGNHHARRRDACTITALFEVRKKIRA